MNDETTRCRIFLSRQCRLLLSDRIIANIFAIWDLKKIVYSYLWSVSKEKSLCLFTHAFLLRMSQVNACVEPAESDKGWLITCQWCFWLQRIFRDGPRQDYWEIDIYTWGMNTLLVTHNRTTSADQANGYIPLWKQNLPLHVSMFHSDEWALKWTIDGQGHWRPRAQWLTGLNKTSFHRD